MAKGEGSSKLLIIVFLGLVGAGGYNYHRNYEAEAAVPRPYASYEEQDLQALLEAYAGVNAELEQRYQSTRSRGQGDTRTGLLDENLKAFEAVQKRSQANRDLGQKLSIQQAAVRDIEAELALRRYQADVMKVHLKRLLTM